MNKKELNNVEVGFEIAKMFKRLYQLLDDVDSYIMYDVGLDVDEENKYCDIYTVGMDELCDMYFDHPELANLLGSEIEEEMKEWKSFKDSV